MHIVSKNLHTTYELNATQNKGVIEVLSWLPWQLGYHSNEVYMADAYRLKEPPCQIWSQYDLKQRSYWGFTLVATAWNNKKQSHTQLDSRKQVIAFQDRVITINIKEAQHPLKWEKQVIDKSSIMLKISTKSMHRVLVWEIGPANNTTRCSRLSKRRLLHAWHPSQLAINLSIDKSKWQIHVNNKSD